MKNYTLPIITDKQDLFSYLKANKGLILAQKKSAIKYADAVGCVLPLINQSEDFSTKEFGVNDKEANKILARVVINTTKILDSHDDVHFDGLWKKSLQETKSIYHLQEHSMKFNSVISDEVNAYAKSVSWKSLGFDYEGNTQALVFDSHISKQRNEFMFDQYMKGYVKNHSVGMQYVKIDMAVNSTDKYMKDEKEIWDKYYDMIVNKEDADENGYFFAVTEAKVIEGSAVLRGSNIATPTISITGADTFTPDKIEPPLGTRNVDYNKLTKVRFF